MLKAPAQRLGLKRSSGQRCGITVGSRATNDQGRLACEPLKLGLEYCLFHLPVLKVYPITVDHPVLFFIDYETTSLDILSDHVVEVGVVSESGACFSTVICPPVLAQGPAVHGIDHAELTQGPSFAIAHSRMTAFIQHIVDISVEGSRAV